MMTLNIRERLQAYIALDRDIDNNIARLETLETKLFSAPSANINGMPKNPSPTTDKFSDLIAKKIQLETQIQELIRKRTEERKAIENITEQLKKPDERAVIIMRYIDGEEWEDIIKMLFGIDKFDTCYDKYAQRAFRLHKSALTKLDERLTIKSQYPK